MTTSVERRPRRACAGGALPDRRARELGARHAGVLPRGARRRRRAHVREQLLHRALRRRAAADQLARTTSMRSISTSRTRTGGMRSARATRRETTAYVLRTGEPHLLTYERTLELIEQRRDRARRGSRPKSQTWLGVPLKADGRVSGVVDGAVVHARRPVHRGGQGAARVRRAAHRRRALSRARDRGDAAAERGARADQQRPGGARRRARAAGDLRRRRRQDPGGLRRAGRRHRHLRALVGADLASRTRSSAACASRTSRFR